MPRDDESAGTRAASAKSVPGLKPGKQDSGCADECPAQGEVDPDGVKIVELDRYAVDRRRVSWSHKYRQEWRRQKIDKLGECVLRMGRHQLENETESDRVLYGYDPKLDQSRDAFERLLAGSKCAELGHVSSGPR